MPGQQEKREGGTPQAASARRWSDGIAIVGMSARFPRSRNVQEFWARLLAGEILISEFSSEQLRSAGVDDATLLSPDYVRRGSVIDDADGFDAEFFGISRREARSRGDEVLSRIGLADRAGSKVRDLSGGQMRRVEIARALLHRPRLLLLDEATVGLDVKARADMLRHVRQLVTEQGIGVLWATHLFDEITPSDNLVILHQGRVLASGEVTRVLETSGAPNVNSAFIRLTGARSGSAEP